MYPFSHRLPGSMSNVPTRRWAKNVRTHILPAAKQI